jgi:hypothetical protein
MIQEAVHGRIVLVTISGTEEEVLQDIANYERDYPTQGYGTIVHEPPKLVASGVWEAKLERLLTCD